jgi:hypothetical protein
MERFERYFHRVYPRELRIWRTPSSVWWMRRFLNKHGRKKRPPEGRLSVGLFLRKTRLKESVLGTWISETALIRGSPTTECNNRVFSGVNAAPSLRAPGVLSNDTAQNRVLPQ